MADRPRSRCQRAPYAATWLAVALAANGPLVGSTAFAQGRTTPTAQRVDPNAFNRAIAAFEAQDYASALGLFQQVYMESRSPEVLYNIGITQARLNHPAEAARALRQFLAHVANPPHRAAIEARIVALDAPA